MVDTVLKQSRTPPRSPIRARCQKCLLRRSRSQRIACDTCEPQVTSKSARRVCMLRYLVSSSAIGYTNRVFAVVAVLKRRFFPSHPLVYAILIDPPPPGGPPLPPKGVGAAGVHPSPKGGIVGYHCPTTFCSLLSDRLLYTSCASEWRLRLRSASCVPSPCSPV